MRNSAAISIAALIAASTATHATTHDATTHWSGPRKLTATGDAGTFRLHSHDTGAASILATDAGTDGSVDAYEG